MNQIVIVLDSVGYDLFLGVETPNLDSIGTVHKAISQGFWTRPAIASMTSGLLPWCTVEGCWHRNLFKGCLNIFNEKRKEGYTVFVATSNGWVLDVLKPTKYYDYPHCFPEMIEDLKAATLDFIEPHFAFLHVMETHAPYSTKDRQYVFTRDGMDIEEEKRKQMDALRFVDREMRKLLGLDAQIIVTSDHGEIFDKNRIGHSVDQIGLDFKVLEVPILASRDER